VQAPSLPHDELAQLIHWRRRAKKDSTGEQRISSGEFKQYLRGIIEANAHSSPSSEKPGKAFSNEDNQTLSLLHDSSELTALYPELEAVLSRGAGWPVFVEAAIFARQTYSRYRTNMASAKDIAKKIAKHAEILHLALKTYSDTNLAYKSPELISSKELLMSAKPCTVLCVECSQNGGSLDTCPENGNWTLQQGQIFGDHPRADTDQANKKVLDIANADLITLSPTSPPPQDLIPPAPPAATLQHAWSAAPPPMQLVHAIAMAAHEFKPKETGPIGAAVSSRKKHPARESLRAFIATLQGEIGWSAFDDPKLRTTLVNAVTALIDNPDVIFTQDDISKAIASLKQ
jgi:hypothetical protein